MLKISKHHYLSLPEFDLGLLPHKMQFEPVPTDPDELERAIERDPEEHDNNWELVERPDTQELEKYWSQVESDLENDPDWVKPTD